jgi:hypothetical protein
MPLTIPASTKAIIDDIETRQEPTVDHEIAHRLAGLHQADGLTMDERKGAWAEASAFNFTPTQDSPWNTHYGPVMIGNRQDGTPFYAPDIKELDEEIIQHWEERAKTSTHPVLRARYADITWDLKRAVTGQQPSIEYAQRAIDAYLTTKKYKEPVQALFAGQRALDLSLSTNDKKRVAQSKAALITLFDETQDPGHTGIWTRIYDTLTENKKIGLTDEEREHLVHSLEAQLTRCTTGDKPDPWSAQAIATRLANHYERADSKTDAQRVIRAYGTTFETLAQKASPTLAMAWLQPVHDEYKNRGMNDDAARVSAASTEKGKDAQNDMKKVVMPIDITEEQVQQLAEELTTGNIRDSLLRTTGYYIPKAQAARDLLKEMLTRTPLTARIGITRVVGDHYAAQAGSIEADPDGRLIMQLAQNIDAYNYFLHRTLERLREKHQPTTEDIMAVLYESPVFTEERRPLIAEGVQAYLDGDYTKVIHTLIPQIEQALRELLQLTGGQRLKPGRNGTMQLKNLNDILREPTIGKAFGDDIKLYLQTLLADERGQNIRNVVCHGLAFPTLFNQRMSDQIFHALLATSLVRETPDPPSDERGATAPAADENAATPDAQGIEEGGRPRA